MNTLKITDVRAAEIAARCEAATPGPWAWSYDLSVMGGYTREGAPQRIVGDDGGRLVSDAWFIAHARADVPDLLADRAVLLDLASSEAAEAQARERTLRTALEAQPCCAGTDGLSMRAAQCRADALALSADHAALDALLAKARAEARREGAQACVEAARQAAPDVEGMHSHGHLVREAVERAAREAGAKEPTP